MTSRVVHEEMGDQAVVLGASMAGLLATRVLTEAYRKVTVIDRDTMPEIGVHRRGVPQGRHGHALLRSSGSWGCSTGPRGCCDQTACCGCGGPTGATRPCRRPARQLTGE